MAIGREWAILFFNLFVLALAYGELALRLRRLVRQPALERLDDQETGEWLCIPARDAKGDQR